MRILPDMPTGDAMLNGMEILAGHGVAVHFLPPARIHP